MCWLFAYFSAEEIERIRDLALEVCSDRPEYLGGVELWLDRLYERMPPWVRVTAEKYRAERNACRFARHPF